ncbi:MAG: molecular chaperone TorD family protein [Burkholderiales bacterium]
MEIFRALAALMDPPGPAHTRLAALLGLPAVSDAAEHTDVFTFQLSPFASVYLGPEGAMGGEARDRVAGFWRALGQDPPPEPDHLATLLALYAALGDQESTEPDAARRALLQHSRTALFWEHIGCWVFAYLGKMEEIAPPFYQGWARVLRTALLDAARDVGPPDRLPLHFRDAAPLPDPREDGFDAFAGGLLAMARSGVLLTRADLVRGGRAIGLAVRVGDRRFLIRTFLGQDAAATLEWLAGEAEGWTARHHTLRHLSPAIAAHWSEKASSTAALLRALAADAQPLGGEAGTVLGAGQSR